MQKTALTFTVTTLVIGVFGAFFRWIQLMNAFDEAGFHIPGKGSTVVLIIYCLLAVAAFVVLTLLWLGRYDRAAAAETALRCPNVVPVILGWVLGAVMAAASCVLLFTAARSATPMLQRLFGAVGILGGLSVPFLFSRKNAGTMGRSCAVVLTVFYCFWCVYGYKTISQDPIVWNYAFEILAILASTVAIYFITEFYFGVGKPTRTLIAVQLAAFLNIAVTFEDQGAPMTVLMGATAVLMLLLEFLLVANMWEKRD